jgi:hypothetical protein
VTAGEPDQLAGVPTGTTVRHHQEADTMADKSPRQHQSKKSGKSLKEKRVEKKTKQDAKRPIK